MAADNSVDGKPSPDAARHTIGSIWHEIQALLEQQKDQLYSEIRNYPSPIAGCDQQFNYLLESQRELTRDLRRLQDQASHAQFAQAAVEAILAFVQSSRWVDSESRRRILSQLGQLTVDRAAKGLHHGRHEDTGSMRNAE